MLRASQNPSKHLKVLLHGPSFIRLLIYIFAEMTSRLKSAGNRDRITDFLISNIPPGSTLLRAIHESVVNNDVVLLEVPVIHDPVSNNSVSIENTGPVGLPVGGSDSTPSLASQKSTSALLQSPSAAMENSQISCGHTPLLEVSAENSPASTAPIQLGSTITEARFFVLDTAGFEDFDFDSMIDDELEEEEDVYTIEGIVGYENASQVCANHSTCYYLANIVHLKGQKWQVRWKGFPPESDSWLTVSGFR